MNREIPRCFTFDENGETLNDVMRVANVVAENCAATNGQVFDMVCTLCSAIIKSFPRDDEPVQKVIESTQEILEKELPA